MAQSAWCPRAASRLRTQLLLALVRFFQAFRFCTYRLFIRVRGTLCSALFS